jgi:hypothetical protein
VPKFTIFWLTVYFGGMLGSFFNPMLGLLAYLFEYYLRPRLHWWGVPWLPDWRWNLMIGSVAILTFVMRRQSLVEMPRVTNPALKWFVAFICSMVVVSTWSVFPEKSWQEVSDFGKLLLLYGLIIGNVRTQGLFDAFMGAHIAGAGWWGWQAYVDPSRISGRLVNVGSSDTLSDNLAAAHLLTVLPIVCVYALMAKDKRLRALALVCAPFIVNTFILCNSRGATIGLAAGLIVALMVARSGHRLKMLGAALAIGVMFFALADQTFIDRQKTTISDDDAGRERLQTWAGARQLLSDRPFGVGGGGFEYLSPIYIAEVVAAHDGEPRSVHNTYLLLATEWGIQSFVLFFGFMGSTMLILNRVRQRAAGLDDLVYYKAVGIQIGLIGTLTAATFSNRLSGESIYWLCALAFALYRVQARDASLAEAPQPAAAPEPEPRFRPAAAAAVS